MMSDEDVSRSHAMMERVLGVVDGYSMFDIMAVFSWILGDMILQAKADPIEILVDFHIMVRTAMKTMTEGTPEGTTIN